MRNYNRVHPRLSQSNRILFLLVAFLSVQVGQICSGQSKWDSLASRTRDAGSFGTHGLWQGNDWLNNQLQSHPEWQLGISGDNTDAGVRVRSVSPGGAASRARIEPNDVILNVNGFQIGMVDGRLYDLSEEINRQADERGVVSLIVQDHRSLRLATVRVQLDQSKQVLRGTVVYRGREFLPSDAIVTVQIDNVSRHHYQVRHGQTVFRANGNEMPFEISYDPSYVNQSDQYQVRAYVTSNGRTIMDTPRPIAVLTQGNPSQVQIQLASLQSSGNNASVITAGYPNFNQIDERIKAMYQRYLGRLPRSIELAALHADPDIVQKLDSLPYEIMAAPEYFDATGNNNRVWLAAVFREIVGRQARPEELEQWMVRYGSVRFSRTELLRQLGIQASR